MSNMLRTMSRGTMAPHHWLGFPWSRRTRQEVADLNPVRVLVSGVRRLWTLRARGDGPKKTGTILDRLRGGLSAGTKSTDTRIAMNGTGASKPKPGFLGRIAAKVANVFKSQRGR